jgi:hypothetical protein
VLVVVLGSHGRLPLLGDQSTGDDVLETISGLYGVTDVHSKEVCDGSVINRRWRPFQIGAPLDIQMTVWISR